MTSDKGHDIQFTTTSFPFLPSFYAKLHNANEAKETHSNRKLRSTEKEYDVPVNGTLLATTKMLVTFTVDFRILKRSDSRRDWRGDAGRVGATLAASGW